VSTELDRKVEALTSSLTELASELKDKADIPQDRITAIEAEIEVKSAQLDDLIAEKKDKQIEAKLADLDERLKSFNQAQARTKAAAILAGVQETTRANHVKSVGVYNENNFLKALVERKNGDQDAREFIKSVLGTSDATGQAIAPNNFVASLVTQLGTENIYRGLFEVVDGVQGVGVDIPYEVTGLTAALLQGAYGSNKDIRDFAFNQATATLYTIAQIADIGNQLLRQSNGAAERAARRRLAKSIAIREATYITNGSGSSQPLGFFPALAAFGQVAAFITALSSEPRLATIARGIAAMETRGVQRANLVFVCNPTDYWEMASEGLSSYTGGWAVDPAGGAAANPPLTSAWGVPLKSDPNWPSAEAGNGLLIDTSEVQIFTGQSFRIDVSSEAGSRFDQNITGFRAEEEFAFNAEAYVRTGRVQKITGL
jgi:HK97 family phage major capsid protein